MIERRLEIVNKAGLHARAAALLVQTANRYRSDVSLELGGEAVNAKSIMGVMMLAASQGSDVTLRVDGPDEEEAAAEIVRLVADGFGEPR